MYFVLISFVIVYRYDYRLYLWCLRRHWHRNRRVTRQRAVKNFSLIYSSVLIGTHICRKFHRLIDSVWGINRSRCIGYRYYHTRSLSRRIWVIHSPVDRLFLRITLLLLYVFVFFHSNSCVNTIFFSY